MAVENRGDTDATSAEGALVNQDPIDLKDSGSSSSGNVAKNKPDNGDNSGKSKGKGGGGGGGGGGGRSDKDDEEGEKKSLAQQMTALAEFSKDVVVEFKKVSWPSREQILRETGSVLFLVAAITLLVLAFDWFLAHAIFMPLEQWARLHGGGVGRGY